MRAGDLPSWTGGQRQDASLPGRDPLRTAEITGGPAAGAACAQTGDVSTRAAVVGRPLAAWLHAPADSLVRAARRVCPGRVFTCSAPVARRRRPGDGVASVARAKTEGVEGFSRVSAAARFRTATQPVAARVAKAP